jgi:hypothetical protein
MLSGLISGIDSRTGAAGEHAVARLFCDLIPKDHVTSALQSLHWLPIKQRNEFKLCLLVHLAINGRAPAYLKDLIITTASVRGQASNCSAINNDLVIGE